MSSPHEPSTRSSEAESLYLQWMEAGASPSAFEALCSERPPLADDLRAIRRGEAFAERAAPAPPAPQHAPPSPPPAGHGASRYARLGELGRGGMGRVLRVRDESLGRELALKLALTADGREGRAEELDPLRLRRFLDEARITARLSHPNIVPLHELGRDEQGRPYFTMKLVEGRELGAVFQLAREQREGWSLPRAVEALVRVCEALVHAHERRIVHRDLKPSNVMVGPLGEVYVMDWGLARRLDEPDARDLRLESASPAHEGSPLRTLDGHVVGTPVYMAPEQARGRVEEVGPAADVYAVGAMLYELLSARQPYSDASGRTPARVALARVLSGPPEPVHALAPRVPAELESICARAMAREPAERYASMRELAADLRAWLEGRVVRAHESGAWPELVKWIGRHRGAAAGTAASLVLLLAAALALRASGASRALAAERERSRVEQEWQSYAAALEAARLSLSRDDPRVARERLERAPAGLRSLEWHALARAGRSAGEPLLPAGEGGRCSALVGSTLLALPRGGRLELHALDAEPSLRRALAVDGRVVALAADATGERLALGVDGHRPLLLALDDPSAPLVELVGASEPPTRTSSVSLSPDGSLLASAHLGQRVRLWSVPQARELEPLETEALQVMCVAWSPSARWLAVAARPSLLLVDPVRRTVARSLPGSSSDYALAWRPGDELLAAAGLDGRVRLWDARDGALRAEWTGHDALVLALAWSADGSRLASGDARGDVWLWTADGSRSPAFVGNFGARVVGLAFLAPESLCVTGADGSARRMALDRPAHELARALGRHEARAGLPAPVGALAFDPTGRLLASGGDDARIWLWTLDGSARPVALEGHGDRIERLAWCAGGSRLASASADGSLRVWSPRGESLAVLEGHDASVTGLLELEEGTLLSCSRDGTLRRWSLADAPRGERVAALGEPLLGMVAARDGQQIVVGAEAGALLVLDARRWTVTQRLALGTPLVALERIDAAHALVAGEKGELERVALASGTRTAWRGPGRIVHALASAEDRVLVADGALTFLDGTGGRQLLELPGLAGEPVFALAHSPRGGRIALGTLGGEVLLLETASAD